MTIYKTAYDTSACSGFILKETKDKLDKGLVSGAFKTTVVELNGHTKSFNLHLLEGGNSSADVIPYFNHPLPIRGFDKDEETGARVEEFVVDVRNFGKWHTPTQEFIVRNQAEFSWNVKRALLNQIWLNERVEVFRDISNLPAAVYAAMVSECIARRFNLDAAEQATISVLACYFYFGLFTDEKEFDEFQKNKVAGNVARITHVPAEKVFSIIEDLKVISSLTEFCEVCKEKTGSVALSQFNIGVLIAICSGTWYGTNARENLATGLEHIPTWMMIVAASLQEATFKRSVLAKLSLRFDKGGAAAAFTKSLDVILGGANVIQQKILKSE